MGSLPQELLPEKVGFSNHDRARTFGNRVTDFLPEMTRTGVAQANMEHRRQHLGELHSCTAPITESTLPPEALPENITDSESNLDNSN